MNSIQLMMSGEAGIFIPDTETTEEGLDQMMKEDDKVMLVRGRTKDGGKITVRVIKEHIRGTIHVEEFSNVARPGASTTSTPSKLRVQ